MPIDDVVCPRLRVELRVEPYRPRVVLPSCLQKSLRPRLGHASERPTAVPPTIDEISEFLGLTPLELPPPLPMPPMLWLAKDRILYTFPFLLFPLVQRLCCCLHRSCRSSGFLSVASRGGG